MFHMKNLDFPQSSLKASLIGDLNHQTFDFLSGLYNNDDILFKNLFILHPRRCFTFIAVLCLLLPHILPCKPVTLIDLSTINAPL